MENGITVIIFGDTLRTGPLQGHLTNIKVTVCHTAGHYSEEYDAWKNDVFRSAEYKRSSGTFWEHLLCPPPTGSSAYTYSQLLF